MDEEALLTVREVARMLALEIGSVYHMISQKRIPVLRLSARCVRFQRSEIENWLATLSVPAETDGQRGIPKQISYTKTKGDRK